MPESQSSFINIRELDKFFGSFQALKNINLSVQEGELICFLGPSGCGKTTLLRAIAGLDLQTHGSIEQAGVDISRLPVTARDFGIVFQSYALFPNLTAEKNIAFGLENAGQSRSNISHRVNELLELVGLPDQGKKYPAQLSGGQQQRIALARAIACSPGLLLLDEPLSALDAKVRVHLRHEVKELQRKLGVTTIMVTHDQEEALAMADRIVVMNHGVIEQIGTPSDVYCNPQSLFVADFIGEMNQIKASVEAPRQVRIGSVKFALDAGSWPDDSPDSVIAAIRPEDVLPLSKDNDAQQQNVTEAYVHEMEFLGSFWRARLRHQSLEKQEIVADFSINAVRRLGLEPGADILIELPSDHLLAFPVPDSV